jgi:hypothetical protein
MKYYPNLFAYLNQIITETAVFQAGDRPIISSDLSEKITHHHYLIVRGKGNYEITFPYLNLADLEHHHNQLQQSWLLEINHQFTNLIIQDQVLDIAVIEDEKKLLEWEIILGKNLIDNTVTIQLQNLTGFCEHLLIEKPGKRRQTRIMELLERLDSFNISDATQPLVVTLQKRYKLDKNLQLIAPKLRQQLRRRAELLSVGRIQEMDAYCLRDYTRRPGNTATEKAGSRQELMGIKRYLDYNTPENRFLIYFVGKILYRECNNHDQVQSLKRTITAFRQQPEIKNLLHSLRRFQFTKPNYVLLQNPIYNSFYRAYLDFIAKRSAKEQLWSFRNQLLTDVIYLCFSAALLRFKNIDFKPLDSLDGFLTPQQGQYLLPSKTKVRLILQDQVYVLQLIKPETLELGDILLKVENHDLNSKELSIKTFQISIWIFWYCPSQTTQEAAKIYVQNLINQNQIKKGLIIYLQNPPNLASAKGRVHYLLNPILPLLQIPDPVTNQGFLKTINIITQYLQRIIQ